MSRDQTGIANAAGADCHINLLADDIDAPAAASPVRIAPA
jgi:hypothetical protein